MKYAKINCSLLQALREPIYGQNFTRRWVVTEDEYPSDYYPPYNQGPFYFLSTSLTKTISNLCPHHCISQTQPRKSSRCFWKFEDTFFGSCLATFEPRVNFINITNIFVDTNYVSMKRRLHPEAAIVHPLKNVSLIVDLHSILQMLPRRRLFDKIQELNLELVDRVNQMGYEDFEFLG